MRWEGGDARGEAVSVDNTNGDNAGDNDELFQTKPRLYRGISANCLSALRFSCRVPDAWASWALHAAALSC